MLRYFLSENHRSGVRHRISNFVPRQTGGEAQGGDFSRMARCEASHSPPKSRIDRFSAPSLGRALGRGGPRPSLLFPFNHPHDPLLRQVAAWIAYPHSAATSAAMAEVAPQISVLRSIAAA